MNAQLELKHRPYTRAGLKSPADHKLIGPINWRDLGVAYSLATLWFVISWKELLFPGMNDYLTFETRPVIEHLVILTNALIATVVVFFIVKFSRDSSHRWIRLAMRAAFIVIGILAFGPLSYEIVNWVSPEIDRLTTYLLPGIVSCVIVLLVLKDKKFDLAVVASNLQVVALLFLPFSILILVKSASVQMFGDDGYLLPRSIQPAQTIANKSPSSQKVVWIIFDEFDFAARRVAAQNSTPLPDIERLRNESFTARGVYSPHRDTLASIPALITGRAVRKAEPVAPNDLLLYPEDNSEPFTLRNSTTVFSELEAAGYRTAAVGWYHPYPRILEGKVSYSVWQPRIDRRCSDSSHLLRCSMGIVTRSLEATPMMGRFLPKRWGHIDTEYVPEEIDTQTKRTAFLLEKADEIITHPELNLLFFHLSIPHAPYVTRQTPDKEGSYFTALEVVNDTLKRFRTALEDAGQWDNTVLIVSSDHPWRGKRREIAQLQFLPEAVRPEVVNDQRIPFIVKFAGQRTRVNYDSEFNSVVTKDIILDIFSGEIKSPEDLTRWLDSRRSDN